MDLLRLCFLELLLHLFLGDILDSANPRPYFFYWLSVGDLVVVDEETILRSCDGYVKELQFRTELGKLSLNFSLVVIGLNKTVVVVFSEVLSVDAISLKLFNCCFSLYLSILFGLSYSNTINKLE